MMMGLVVMVKGVGGDPEDIPEPAATYNMKFIEYF